MNVPEIKEAEAVVSPDSILCVDDKVVLGEYTFNVKHDASLGDIAKNFSPALPPSLADDLVKRIVLLPDDTMRDFTRLFTEVITRIRINKETKTVNTGGLWTEEYIPPETLFYSVVLIHAPYAKDEELENEEEVRNFLEERISSRTFYRLGGNETVGKGIVRITFQGVKNGN
ncbi:type III-B CRISPR module RAMP protein Cmr4 [bacterium]|nr:MAG: type III-B CRISPR module RAMP protein Cmr4 [bacterium]